MISTYGSFAQSKIDFWVGFIVNLFYLFHIINLFVLPLNNLYYSNWLIVKNKWNSINVYY